MNEERSSALRAYYESLSDDALLLEAAPGPEAFVPDAWMIVSEEMELRGLQRPSGLKARANAQGAGAVANPIAEQPTRLDRLGARIDALPPTIRPAVFGALLIVLFAMARGAWLVLPIALIVLFATSAHPWTSLLTGVGVALLTMTGGALSGLAYGLVGRHVRTMPRGGYYVTGVVTLAPYMFVLPYILRLSKSQPFWRLPSGEDLAISGGMTLLFGIALARSWFGPDGDGAPGSDGEGKITQRAT
jgi:hypothetical protein